MATSKICMHGSALGQTIGKAGEHPKRQVSQTIDPTRTRNHGASLPASMCSVVVLIACRTLGTLKKRSVKGEYMMCLKNDGFRAEMLQG